MQKVRHQTHMFVKNHPLSKLQSRWNVIGQREIGN